MTIRVPSPITINLAIITCSRCGEQFGAVPREWATCPECDLEIHLAALVPELRRVTIVPESAVADRAISAASAIRRLREHVRARVRIAKAGNLDEVAQLTTWAVTTLECIARDRPDVLDLDEAEVWLRQYRG